MLGVIKITECPKCNDKDFIGIYERGIIIKMVCLLCNFEQWTEKQQN